MILRSRLRHIAVIRENEQAVPEYLEKQKSLHSNLMEGIVDHLFENKSGKKSLRKNVSSKDIQIEFDIFFKLQDRLNTLHGVDGIASASLQAEQAVMQQKDYGTGVEHKLFERIFDVSSHVNNPNLLFSEYMDLLASIYSPRKR